ncbi:MAG: hypothetical protein ABI672_11370 [Vicinamibacteria bacterium]
MGPLFVTHSRIAGRGLLLLALAGFTGACAKPSAGSVLLGKLDEKGFLKYAGPNTERVRAEIADKGWPALFGDTGRVYAADGLTLAKGGVGHFIEKVRPFLEGQSVVMPTLKDDLRQESYTLLINGAPLPIWTNADLTRELSAQPGITGGLAAARSFALINKLLEDAKSPERAYAIYGGAALSAIFLTDEQMAIIKSDPLAVPKFIPYRLTTDFPFFGQPQQ